MKQNITVLINRIPLGMNMQFGVGRVDPKTFSSEAVKFFVRGKVKEAGKGEGTSETMLAVVLWARWLPPTM